MRRRSLLRRATPWLIAFTIVGTVGWFARQASLMDDDAIVERAESIRVGAPLDGVPKDPTTALDILEPLLERNPRHVQGLIQAARSYADLRDWNKATGLLDRAAEAAETTQERTSALRIAVNYLLQADLYDEAVATSERIAELNPDDPIYDLQVGVALYRGSFKSQSDVVRTVTSPNKTGVDVAIERDIEAFVTDIWGEPDPDAFVEKLMPDLEGEPRAKLVDDIVDARTRFQRASQRMAGYGEYAGFDADVSRNYVEMLLRSGRVYEASLESAIALRQSNVPIGIQRSLLETVAECFELLDEHGHAADRYQEIVTSYGDAWVPPRYAFKLMLERLADEDWDWILANDAANSKSFKQDILPDYLRAAALTATGDRERARVAIQDPFSIVSLGTLMPPSVRGEPAVRREILMLAYDLFSEIGDTRAITALDGILSDAPYDHEARRLRVSQLRSRGLLEGAVADAFELLTPDRRDQADYLLWLDTATALSLQRYGATLEERADKFVSDERSLQVAAVTAAFEASQLRRGRNTKTRDATDRFSAFLPQEPALAHYVTAARIDRHDFARARVELRQLSDAYPEVQQFRYSLGRVLVREGKLEAAAGVFRELLDSVPKDTESLDLAMRIEMALGRQDEAANLVNAMILRDPLGVGAVRYGHRLLDGGYPDQADRLFERIVKLSDHDVGLDAKLIAARAALLQEDWSATEAWVAVLNEQYPQQVEVAMLALQLGLARNASGLIQAAVATLEPLAAGLFPDLMVELCKTLLDGGLYEEMLRIFDVETRTLPAVRPALRYLADAAKATGRHQEAEELLASLGDLDSVRDRFILLALLRQPEEAGRRLRLENYSSDIEDERDLCIAVGNALSGFRALVDPEPIAQLAELGLEDEFDPASLQLLDAALRLRPEVLHVDDVVPQGVVLAPRETYPDAGADVERLVTLARESPDEATEALDALILLLISHQRPFWERESRFLAELCLEFVPGLVVPSRILAEKLLARGEPREAIEVLKVVMQAGELPIDPRTLELFVEATEAFGHAEWGLALVMAHPPTDPAAILLADSLAARGKPKDALDSYQAFLAAHPGDVRATIGSLRALTSLGRQAEAAVVAQRILEQRPEDHALGRACAEILCPIRRPDPEVVTTLETLRVLWPDEHIVLEALARAHRDDPGQMRAILEDLIARVTSQPVEVGTPAASERTTMLMGAAREARKSGIVDLARTLNELALKIEPGAIIQFRELAFLELEQGNLDKARRYFEVITFVDQNDKESALALARLLFEKAGQPHVAADVIQRAYQHNMPPQAVEILAAEEFLRGQPEEALTSFAKVRNSPLITADTFLSVGRIVFASSLDDPTAVSMFEQFLLLADPEHPARPRAEYLRALAAGERPDAAKNKKDAPEKPAKKAKGKAKAAADEGEGDGAQDGVPADGVGGSDGTDLPTAAAQTDDG